MGEIEKILTAVDELLSEDPRTSMRYYAQLNMMAFWFTNLGCKILTVIVCFSLESEPRFYYILNPKISFVYPKISDSFVKNRDELIRKNERIVFSGKNVFDYLQLGKAFEKSPEGPLADLHALCIVLKEKKRMVNNAFSEEKISVTYNALSSMEGNDEEEINSIIKDLSSTY